MEHRVRGRAEQDCAPRGAEERSDGAPSLRSSKARSPPQLATERSEGANIRLKLEDMSEARVAFERKLNGPMVPQVGARDRIVPFDGTMCGYKLFE